MKGALAVGIGIWSTLISSAAAAPLINAVAADGFTATYADAAALNTDYPYSTTNPEFNSDAVGAPGITVSSLGYAFGTGAETSHSRTIPINRRQRLPYSTGGNQLLPDGAKVALSSVVLQTDTVPAGVTNSSTEVSPKPIAQWADRPNRVIGGTATEDVEIVAFHWSGPELGLGVGIAVARAWFRDAANTKQTAVATSAVVVDLPGGNDRFPVQGFLLSVPCTVWSDATAIADGTSLILEAEVLPLIGRTASVQTTVGGTVDARGFAPRTFLKHTARATNPVYAVVSTAGTDDTVLATGLTAGGLRKIGYAADLSDLRTNAFQTRKSAVEALRAASNLTGGVVDGCIIYLRAGTHVAGVTTGAATYQGAGELIIETDPTDAAYSAAISLTATVNYRLLNITYRNVDIQRTGTDNFTLSALTNGRISLVNCKFTNTSSGTGTLWATVPLYIDGLEVIGTVPTSLFLSGSVSINLCRGLKAGTGATFNVDAHNLLGCELINATYNWSTRSYDNSIQAYFSNLSCTAIKLGVNTAPLITGMARVQFVEEFISTTSAAIDRPSGDSDIPSITHYIEWYRTTGGAGIWGRDNRFYDETVGTVRTHKFVSEYGNIYVSYAHKSGWFLGVSGAGEAEAQLHEGNRWVNYGVTSRANFYRYAFANGTGGAMNGSESRAHMGRQAVINLALTTTTGATPSTGQDPLYDGGLTQAAYISAGAIQAGLGGTPAGYKISNGASPCKGVVPVRLLPKDLFGAARPATNDTIGCAA